MITFQVPLGIILKNENKIDEMTEILTDLHQYVPCVTQEESASLSTGASCYKKDRVYASHTDWWRSVNCGKNEKCY